MNNKEIYLDHAASALMLPEVVDYLCSLYSKQIGNSSSVHHSGVKASLELEKARNTIARRINCKSEEIYFTSGATEANNLAIIGQALINQATEKNEIIISSIEHSSVNESAFYLSKLGFKIIKCDVDKKGFLNISQLEEKMNEKTLLVSIIHGNNEIGTIQDLKIIGSLCNKKSIYFHSDGAQSFCKVDIDVIDMNLDLFTMSAHKIHGPKGIGAIYINEKLKVQPLLFGGGQERSMRPGTVPVELIASMSFASKIYTEQNINQLKRLKEYFVKNLMNQFTQVTINGSLENRLPNQLNFFISGFSGKYLMQKLDQSGIRISVGSACHSTKKTPSHVLKAIGLTDEEAFESIRISWGLNTSLEEIDLFIEQLKVVVSQAPEQ